MLKFHCSEMFLSGSRDRTIRLWDLRSPLCQGLMKTNGTPIGAFDPAGLIFGKKIARKMHHQNFNAVF